MATDVSRNAISWPADFHDGSSGSAFTFMAGSSGGPIEEPLAAGRRRDPGTAGGAKAGNGAINGGSPILFNISSLSSSESLKSALSSTS